MADTSPDFTTGISGAAAKLSITRTYEKVIDASVVANNMTSTTSHALFVVPARQLHVTTIVEVLTPAGATMTADIGVTGTDVDSFIDGVDLNATAGTIWQSGHAATAEVNSILGTAAGYVTTAATTLSILANNTMTAGKFRVTSVWIDLTAAAAST